MIVEMLKPKPNQFYGKPCRKGHDGLRYVLNHACVHCQREYGKKNSKTEAYRNYQKEYQKKFRQLPEQKARQSAYNRSESAKSSYAKYAASEKGKLRNERWRQSNPLKCVANWRNYDMKKRRAMPKWLTKDQIEGMNAMYAIASVLRLEVDHIEPIAGKDRCGLHVPWNLQLLSRSDNARKGNRQLSQN